MAPDYKDNKQTILNVFTPKDITKFIKLMMDLPHPS